MLIVCSGNKSQSSETLLKEDTAEREIRTGLVILFYWDKALGERGKTNVMTEH